VRRKEARDRRERADASIDITAAAHKLSPRGNAATQQDMPTWAGLGQWASFAPQMEHEDQSAAWARCDPSQPRAAALFIKNHRADLEEISRPNRRRHPARTITAGAKRGQSTGMRALPPAGQRASDVIPSTCKQVLVRCLRRYFAPTLPVRQ
jgi:hypothetical protein